MCGLILTKGSNPIHSAFNQLLDQSERGRQGFGYVAIMPNGAIKANKSATMEVLADIPAEVCCLLLHHRIPTSTANTASSAHPIIGKYKDKTYYLLHNGVISNCNELQATHQLLGIDYTSTQPDVSFNDSESLLWELALYLNGDIPALRVNGSWGFMLVESNRANKLTGLYLGKDATTPLVIDNYYNDMVIASTGKGDSLWAYHLYTLNIKTDQIISQPLYIDTLAIPANKVVGYNSNTDYTKTRSYLEATSNHDDDYCIIEIDSINNTRTIIEYANNYATAQANLGLYRDCSEDTPLGGISYQVIKTAKARRKYQLVS